MFRFLALLILVHGMGSCSLALATYIPTNCAMKIANKCLAKTEVDRFELGTLTAGGGFIATAYTVTNGRFSPFKTGDGVSVRAASGTNIICPYARVHGFGAGAVGFQSVYSDDESTYDDTALINPVYHGFASSSPTTSLTSVSINQGYAGESWFGKSGGLKVPSLKYLSMQGSGANVSATIYCNVYAN